MSLVRLWPAAAHGIRTLLLDRRIVGHCLGHAADSRPLWSSCFFIWPRRAEWRAGREVCRILGRFLHSGGIVRRISAARVLSIHADSLRGLLACCPGPFLRLRTHSLEK